MSNAANSNLAPMTGGQAPDAAGLRAAIGRALVASAFLVAASLPLLAYSNLVLNQIYVQGSFLWDVGLQAFLMWQGDPRLPTPHIFGGESFYATHVAPILSLVTVVARFLPASMPVLFAAVIGIAHALPALGVLWILVEEHRLRSPWALALAALLALAFAFSGLALAIARYPHFEMLTAGTAILFIAALLRRRLILAGIFFALSLLTREDAGFHLVAILSVFLALDWWRDVRRPTRNATLVFTALALLYSIAAMALQSALFPDHPSSFARVYLGHPAFADITPTTLPIRILSYLLYRTYLFLPAAIALGWAVLARNPYLIAGYVAILPWTVLHLLAATPLAATLSSYYAFPFMIASFWPLAAARLGPRPLGMTSVIAGFALMIAASFTALSHQHNPAGIRYPGALLSRPSEIERQNVDRTVAALVAAKPMLGRLLVDGSVLALAPDNFAWRETVLAARDNALAANDDAPDTVIYFAHGYEADTAKALAAKAHLENTYIAPGTPIVIASRRSPRELGGLGNVLPLAQ